ncbi:hypothetical protein [Azospirillum palustre]
MGPGVHRMPAKFGRIGLETIRLRPSSCPGAAGAEAGYGRARAGV